jgi:hypothetical protein
MTFGFLVGDIIRITGLTILSEIAMNAIEQKDYARLIKFTGVSAAATDVVSYMSYLNAHPPVLLTLTKASYSGWVDFFKTFKKIFG